MRDFVNSIDTYKYIYIYIFIFIHIFAPLFNRCVEQMHGCVEQMHNIFVNLFTHRLLDTYIYIHTYLPHYLTDASNRCMVASNRCTIFLFFITTKPSWCFAAAGAPFGSGSIGGWNRAKVLVYLYY